MPSGVYDRSHIPSSSFRGWRGGIQILGGYRYVFIGPVSEMKSTRRIKFSRDGRHYYQAEHITIAEKALGRPLKGNEQVHHINSNKLDNRNSNLLICTTSYHTALHHRMSDLYMKEHFTG